MESPKVSVGITSILGWFSALGALLPTIIKSVEEGSVAFNGPEKYLAIAGIAVGMVTQIGRYLQAHKLISASIPVQISLEGLGSPQTSFEQGSPIIPESAVKPDGPIPATVPTESLIASPEVRG